jgi:hypothetical protein
MKIDRCEISNNLHPFCSPHPYPHPLSMSSQIQPMAASITDEDAMKVLDSMGWYDGTDDVILMEEENGANSDEASESARELVDRVHEVCEVESITTTLNDMIVAKNEQSFSLSPFIEKRVVVGGLSGDASLVLDAEKLARWDMESQKSSYGDIKRSDTIDGASNSNDNLGCRKSPPS